MIAKWIVWFIKIDFRWLINLFDYDDRYDWIDLDVWLYYELNFDLIIDINYIYIPLSDSFLIWLLMLMFIFINNNFV